MEGGHGGNGESFLLVMGGSPPQFKGAWGLFDSTAPPGCSEALYWLPELGRWVDWYGYREGTLALGRKG